MTIDDADIELVLDAYENWRNAPTLNDYFSSVAYPKTTKLAREAALILMRQAWVAALSRKGMRRRLTPSHARGYVMRNEAIARDTLNFDGLPVKPMIRTGRERNERGPTEGGNRAAINRR
jgi:hypothetical protein